MPKSAHPNVDKAMGWGRSLLRGKVPACRYIHQAVQRHFDDLAASRKRGYRYKFDPAKAEKKLKLIQLLPHTKGEWAFKRQLISLEPWQLFGLAVTFGWVKKKGGHRRFRESYWEVPRKNGKSVIAAGVGISMFVADGEFGAEVYSGATTEKQAWEVFGPAREMAKRTPPLLSKFGITVNAKSLVRFGDMSKFEPVIGKPGDGSSPHCSIIDEFHEHQTDDQLATMETGMGARDQPLSLVISTAGDNLAGPCREDWLDCQKILELLVEDERTFALIHSADDTDDSTSEATLRKANRNVAVCVGGKSVRAATRNPTHHARDPGHV